MFVPNRQTGGKGKFRVSCGTPKTRSLVLFGLACVASVSARVRLERRDESKKKRIDGGRRGERRNRLPANPTILKNCVRPRTQLLIGAVLLVLIT